MLVLSPYDSMSFVIFQTKKKLIYLQ